MRWIQIGLHVMGEHSSWCMTLKPTPMVGLLCIDQKVSGVNVDLHLRFKYQKLSIWLFSFPHKGSSRKPSSQIIVCVSPI